MPFDTVTFRPQGLNEDVSPDNVGPDEWTRAENTLFREAASNKASGYIDLAGATLFAPSRLQYVTELANTFWLYMGADGVGVWDRLVHFDITPVPWVTQDRDGWSDTKLNGIPVQNHRDVAPYFWDLNTANPITVLPGWDPTWTAKVMRAFKFNLFALGMTEGGVVLDDAFRWSASAAPGTLPAEWTPTASNDAGNLSVGGTRGEIIDAIGLRDVLLVFKPDSTYAVIPVGGTLIFGQREQFSTLGMLADHCGIEYKGRALVLTDQDVVLTDGLAAESIVDNKTRKALFSQMDEGIFERSFVTRDPGTSQIGLFFPSINFPNPGAECNAAYLWDPRLNEWTFRTLSHGMSDYALGFYLSNPAEAWDNDPEAWDLDGTTWSVGNPSQSHLATVSQNESRIYGFSGDQLREAGETIDAVLEKKGIQLGDVDRLTYCSQVWVSADADVGTQIKVELGGHDQGPDNAIYTATETFDAGVDKQLTLEAMGRYLAIRFTSIGDSAFRVNNFRLKWRDGPKYAV